MITWCKATAGWSLLGLATSCSSAALTYLPLFRGYPWQTGIEGIANQFGRIGTIARDSLAGEFTYNDRSCRPFWTSCILAPVLEELQFQGLMQMVLLRELPRLILQKANVPYAHYVDSTCAKALRIVTTALFFALAHGTLPHSLPQLASGLVFGIAYEASSHSLLTCTIMHITNNCLPYVACLLSQGDL